jgi:hypothetical protein
MNKYLLIILMCLFKLFDNKYKKVYPENSKICNSTFVVVKDEEKYKETKI